MRYKVRDIARTIDNANQANPYDGSSLMPMLICGLVLTLVGMIAAVLLS